MSTRVLLLVLLGWGAVPSALAGEAAAKTGAAPAKAEPKTTRQAPAESKGEGDAEQKPGESAKAPGKLGPLDVEILMRDGSMIRGQLKNDVPFTIVTAYGTLTVPVGELRRFQRGDRLSKEEVDGIAQAIKALDDEDFEKREGAQTQLVSMGPRSLPHLVAAVKSAESERRSRLNKIIAQLQATGIAPQPLDLVKTRTFEAAGEVINLKVPIEAAFGSFDARLDQIVRIRWLAYGERTEVKLTPAEASLEWYDTGIDLQTGEILAVTASGYIQYGGYTISPTGHTAWGQTQPYMIGTLIGKVGQSGESFSIGFGTRTGAGGGGRLYLQIFIPQNNEGSVQQMTGKYELVIATGTVAEELKVPQK